jgi:hypothetical protein
VTFLDVDAPDTNWRSSNEDPIPFLFGRMPAGGFLYRFATGRPLDGHARTDASFWKPGTKALTKTGRVMPYQFWPGWKRGLLITRLPAFGLAPYTVVAGANEALLDFGPWWVQWQGPALAWLPLAGYAGTKGTQYALNRNHNRHVIEPITAAAMNIVRSREIRVEIPRSLVKTERVSTEEGRIWLPLEWSGAEGDRDNLTDMLQERLGSPVALSFDMAGRSPSARVTIPKQPPKLVSWEEMLENADSVSPFLGLSAAGSVFWDLGDDSPHMGIPGGSGSGKSELMAWIVAQFMRGGCGTVVLDPKGTSHAWLLQMPEVLYCSTGASLHDTIMWLDSEMDRRAASNRESVSRGGADLDFPRLVVVLEERNSLQDKLRDHWADIREPGQPQLSPAVRALDRLASMGRTLCITVLLAAQATAQQDIGKKNNYGAWAIAGRMASNHYKNIGVSPKPAISAKPGRFAYVVAGHATVFQAAYPDLKRQSERLKAWARSGATLCDVKAMMQQGETAAFPSVSPVTSEAATEPFLTLSEYTMKHPDIPVTKLRSDRDRDRENFPKHVTKTGSTFRYRESDLDSYYEGRAA